MSIKSHGIGRERRERLARRWFNFLFGRRLATGEERQQQIGALAGIPILGLDALASASYGPEAALTILIPLGALAPRHNLPITIAIVLILTLVALSYRQTISAYPNGGGSYTVAKENLGERWGLLAGAALTLDYVLNVAVAISAGVAAIGSAYRPLLPHTLLLCLGLLVLLVLVNLRGVREAGFAFMVPTYLFVGCLLGALAIGIFKGIAQGGHPPPVAAPPGPGPGTEPLTAWLLLRAFGNGCTAMTGVEAVSNAVPIFRESKTRHAELTLMSIMGLLAVLLLGIAWVCRTYGIVASPPGSPEYESVLSKLAAAVAGRGWFYYLTMAGVFSVLALSANTSFAGFPRLCRLMALDHYLPEPFALRGRRLVYTFGITTLAVLAAILLLAFKGITNGLIPLFAIGALLAFTLSQTGMVVHWLRRPKEPRARFHLGMNATGAVATGITVLIVLVSKFTEGAWITVLLLGAIVFALRHVQARECWAEKSVSTHKPLDCHWPDAPIMVVPIADWTQLAEKALLFAMRLSPEVHVVQVLTEELPKQDLSKEWNELVETPVRKAGANPPDLTVIHSRYRQQLRPIVTYALEVIKRHPGRIVIVVVTELMERRWYHNFLGYATLLRGLLLLKGNPRIAIMTVPWYLRPRHG